MKRVAVFFFAISLLFLFVSESHAAPGDYTLRLKVGPSFAVKDYENQIKFGGAFDYDLGFGWGVGLEALIGVKSQFRFQLFPNARFTFLYVGPAELFFMFGGGYEVYESNSAFGFKFGPGIILPLTPGYELISDFTVNLTPIGTPGTQVTLDWMLGFGFRFSGGR